MLQNAIQNSPKLAEKYVCEICLYECSKKSDWKKHISTTKHKNAIQLLQNATSDATIVATSNINVKSVYNCDCGKIFKTNSGLWKHTQKCTHKIVEQKLSDLDKEIPIQENQIIMIKTQSKIKFVRILYISKI